MDGGRLDQQGRATPCRVSGQPRVHASGGVCRQPGSLRPANVIGGGARAKGLEAGVAGSARRSRCLNVFLVTAASSMLAITLTAPPQWSQVIDLEHALQPVRLRLIEASRAGVGSSMVQHHASRAWPASLVHAADDSA